MKLKIALLSSLFGLSSAWAAGNEHINVNVQVQDETGKVVIIKEVDGQTQTIEETFAVSPDSDVETIVDAIIAEHGVNQDSNKIRKEVIKKVQGGDQKMVWLQKNDDIDVDISDGQAHILIKKDNNGEVEVIEETFDVDSDTDINVLVDELMATHGVEPGDAEVHRKVIKIDKNFTHIENNKPRMGFMASANDSGWEIISVVPDSGAAEAGLLKGDVIISIDDQSTQKDGLALTEFIDMDQKEGDVIDVKVLRHGNEFVMGVTAKVIDSPDIIMTFDGTHKWLSSSGNDFKFASGDLDGMFKGLNVDVKHLDKMVQGMGEHDIHVVTTGDADAYFFSAGKMNQWLGKNHHFSTITPALGKYFGTQRGVLVLEVDQNNKLGLQDGDVIVAINDNDINSPKDVVKTVTGFKSDETFTIEIIREKETLYLES